MPVEYQCAVCKKYKSPYEGYFCLHCQEMICYECAESEATQYKCFRCGRVYSIEEARANFTECPNCFNCNYCRGPLKIKYENDRYFFECYHCQWSSDNQDPVITGVDKLSAINAGKDSLPSERLYEDYNVYCPKCKGTLLSTKNNVVNSLANVFPKLIFRTKYVPVNLKVEIPYSIKNSRPEGAFFRLDWEAGEGLQINQLTKAAEFDFHAPFIKTQKNGKLSIKADRLGEAYLLADLTYKFDEIRYGAGRTRIKIGPIIAYPKVEILRDVKQPVLTQQDNLVNISVKNGSDQEIKQLIVSDMILEGAVDYSRKFWEIKNLQAGERVELSYRFKAHSEFQKIKFDGLRVKMRFTKFMPTMFFHYVSPMELVELG